MPILDCSFNINLFSRGAVYEDWKVWYKNYIPFEELMYKLKEPLFITFETRVEIFKLVYNEEYDSSNENHNDIIHKSYYLGNCRSLLTHIDIYKRYKRVNVVEREEYLSEDIRKRIFKLVITDKLAQIHKEWDRVSRINDKSSSYWRRDNNNTDIKLIPLHRTSYFTYYHINSNYNFHTPSFITDKFQGLYYFTEGLLIKKEYYYDVLFSILTNTCEYENYHIDITKLNSDWFIYANMKNTFLKHIISNYTKNMNKFFKVFHVQKATLEYKDLYHIQDNIIPYKSNREFTAFVNNLLTPFENV